MKITFYSLKGKVESLESTFFSVRHIRNICNKSYGGSTIIVPHDKNKIFISYCSPKDHFCRKKGIVMALQKYVWWRFKELYPIEGKPNEFHEPLIIDYVTFNNEIHVMLHPDTEKCEDKDKFWYLHKVPTNESLEDFLKFYGEDINSLPF